MRAAAAEFIDRGNDRGAGERAALGRGQLQFLLAIDDGAGFEQHRRHVGVAQHEQLVEAVNAGFGVEQFAAAIAHERQRVMRRELQAARLQRLAQESLPNCRLPARSALSFEMKRA